jgi:hypothetical protein
MEYPWFDAKGEKLFAAANFEVPIDPMESPNRTRKQSETRMPARVRKKGNKERQMQQILLEKNQKTKSDSYILPIH